MQVAVQVLVLVPAEAACLADTVVSFRDLGEVTVHDTTGDPAVARAARAAGVVLERADWSDSYAECFNGVLSTRRAQPRLLVHADEVVEGGRDGWAGGVVEGRPATILIRHRTAPDTYFNEEREARFAPPGDTLAYAGRFPPVALERGRPRAAEDLPALPLVLAHYPGRWPGLAEQRVRRTIAAVEAALGEGPDDAEHVYALLHCHVSLRDWPQVVHWAGRWREVAGPGAPHRSLVDYHEACGRLRTGHTRVGVRLLREATVRSPKFADAWFLLGEIRRLAGDPAGAEAAYRRAHDAGLDAEPVAVEDHSLATWRPLEELARLAEADGRLTRATALRQEAAAIHPREGGGHGGP